MAGSVQTHQLMPQEFDVRAALAAMLFIVTRLPNSTTKHQVFKLLYFAEKLHLERYGRLIVGDKYCAMRYGPVPSKIYDAIQFVAGRAPYPSLDEALKAGFRQSFKVHGHYITACCKPELGDLSESDVTCLKEAIGDYGEATFDQRTELSHDEAWNYSWDQRGPYSMMDFERIVGTLPNADILLEHLKDPYPDFDDEVSVRS